MAEKTTSYVVEFAKSSRGKCKKCKNPVEKGEIRLGVTVKAEGAAFDQTSWYHPPCFNLPRKLVSGPQQISVEDFVNDLLEDSTGGEILPSQKDSLIEAIGSKDGKASGSATKEKSTASKSSKPKAGRGVAASDDTPIGRIALLYESQQGDDDGPPVKKTKMSKEDQDMIDLYEKYHKETNKHLTDILRFNRQVHTGGKPLLLFRVIDGELRGRLARCELCGGRLKITDEKTDTVTCNGSFDETMQQRIPCEFKCPAAQAPRWQPWYTEEPTEEQKAEMDRLAEEATQNAEAGGGSLDAGAASAVSDDKAQLVKQAEGLAEWSLASKKGLQAASEAICRILKNYTAKHVDLPQDDKRAKMEVGKIILENKDKTSGEIMEAVIKKFGFAEVKAEMEKKRGEVVEHACKNVKNAPLVMAFHELSQLYYKGGNRNAGLTYSKVANAIREMDKEVTEANAMSLGKGAKTKVAGIGPSSAEKILEFVKTGTMEKLEEKRANST